MNYGKQIKTLRTNLGITQKSFSEITGIALSTLTKIESNHSNAGLPVIDKIISLPQFEMYTLWLMKNVDAPENGQFTPDENSNMETLSSTSINRKPTLESLNDQHIQLPFYEISASAGVGLLAEVEERPKSISFEPNWLRSEVGVCPSNVFLMLVDGDSMQPTLKNGSMIMVNRDVDNLSDGVYVMRHDNNLLVKRLQMLPGGIIRVKSDNTMYDPWEITKSQLDGEELALIGRVVWTGQKM
ncbi:helix-turn-helix transcriptional regulator [Moritella sp. Urea-trap-13]|uniref:XRE family transcriptional regulator n=1 Tax=Moritella sp. Urea-trap-13 TaxID=2058327 RepID=UPI000C328F21|nr:helix-turn-helix transcriptional regulator [Moritella sp. Urea-trap-13]PKH06429.1 XRE family transcriptional regulator [Moritella sp. Urea-trap-13]